MDRLSWDWIVKFGKMYKTLTKLVEKHTLRVDVAKELDRLNLRFVYTIAIERDEEEVILVSDDPPDTSASITRPNDSLSYLCRFFFFIVTNVYQ